MIPIVVVIMGFAFNTINAFLIAYYFVLHQNDYTNSWFFTPWFIGGLTLFLGGYVITRKSDSILRNLRGPGESDYKIPMGFFFRYVSSPNYLGEIVQWAGWAILTSSVAGFVFLVWTVANLLPRALSHHRWYQQEFVDYPPERKAIFPFIL